MEDLITKVTYKQPNKDNYTDASITVWAGNTNISIDCWDDNDDEEVFEIAFNFNLGEADEELVLESSHIEAFADCARQANLMHQVSELLVKRDPTGMWDISVNEEGCHSMCISKEEFLYLYKEIEKLCPIERVS